MLKHLHIRNFAVIEELEVTFEPGMTVFTGETGAGKSIIVDALGLALGDRAESSVIRAQCEAAEISAVFALDPGNPGITERLDEQGITPDQQELILRRLISRDGRSRAWANGSTVPIHVLRDLGDNLVDIHGQHAHQSLLRRDMQRLLLDTYGWYTDVLNRVREHYAEWSAASGALQQLAGNTADRAAHMSLLHFQVEELEAQNLATDELDTLNAEHARLANASRIMETCNRVWECLSENEQALLSELHRHINELQELVQFDQGLGGIVQLLDGAAIQIKEGGAELRRYLATLDPDPERLRVVEDRLAALHDLARKHKVRVEELPAHLQSLRAELKNLEASDERAADLEQRRDTALKEYTRAAAELHTWRVKTAQKLSREIEEQLRELGMPAAHFTIDVHKTEAGTPLPEGLDRIEYLVAINPGSEAQPLSKVASGGELSRISLAIQVIGSKDKGLPVLVFDEVDAGIGGATAEIVGKLLHSLSGKRQIFCVTHLPQVAALGDHHLQITKTAGNDTTAVKVTVLGREQRIGELARMLGGVRITGTTRAHAQEMLKVERKLKVENAK